MKQKLTSVRDYVWSRFWLRDALSSGIFFCLLLGLDFTFRYFYRGTGMTSCVSPIPCIFTLAWAVMLTALVRLLPQLGQRIAMGVTGTLFSVLYLTHALLMKAKGTFFSFSILIFAGDGFKFLDASYLQIRKHRLYPLLLFLLMPQKEKVKTCENRCIKHEYKYTAGSGCILRC